MKFNTMYVSKWADGDPGDVRVIETPTFTLHSMTAGDLCDRITEIGKYCRANEIHSIVLCPGFTHSMVAQVAKEVGNDVAVAVSRSDGPGSVVSAMARKEAKKGLIT
ncbi:MAG: DUF6506 family protein [Candidatus Fermentibacteria bacterium]|nr:DUF6506 family protein [Candidatus Fermentibacteria bacterium]